MEKSNHNIADEFLDNWQGAIEKTTEEIVGSIENSVREVGRALDREFGKRPWSFLSTCIGGGIVVGYMLGRKKGHSESIL
ncbi:MAG: hypothetical protein JWQ35_2134 [Bacteriovoracaceae bacterium]|nr:hypothetical protein [Bacteriovoracaceae bacterium]